ncbi:MAG TPA: universal stress protein [Gammaproteobacteria bacterium]|nr:universal stress protein [Gammaproteobacteria bacterium]
MFKNILVPVDGSKLSHKAIKPAIDIALAFKASITGYYAAPEYHPEVWDEYVPPNFVTPDQFRQMSGKVARKYLSAVEKAAARAGVATSCFSTNSDVPYEAIIKAAQKRKCDLIVMASHGRSGLSRLMLGSQTYKVVTLSKVPVMVCH